MYILDTDHMTLLENGNLACLDRLNSVGYENITITAISAEQESLTPKVRRDIIDVVTSIMVYKFATLSRTEIRAMLGINLSEEPRAIRETREEQTLLIVFQQLAVRLQQEIPEEMRSRLTTFPLPALVDLSTALLNFSSLDDLEDWLSQHPQSGD